MFVTPDTVLIVCMFFIKGFLKHTIHTFNGFLVGLFLVLQVRDLSLAYLLVGITYLYVGVLIFAAFPSPPLSKECLEPVRLFLILARII